MWSFVDPISLADADDAAADDSSAAAPASCTVQQCRRADAADAAEHVRHDAGRHLQALSFEELLMLLWLLGISLAPLAPSSFTQAQYAANMQQQPQASGDTSAQVFSARFSSGSISFTTSFPAERRRHELPQRRRLPGRPAGPIRKQPIRGRIRQWVCFLYLNITLIHHTLTGTGAPPPVPLSRLAPTATRAEGLGVVLATSP